MRLNLKTSSSIVQASTIDVCTPIYCMELGVIRDLQGQATAKSGASKQSSSFLKATTMTLFTISDSEKASYIDQIYTSSKLINIVVPGIIDERSVNTKRVLNPWKRSENHTLCLNSAKAIGCTVINIGTQDLVEGRVSFS
ncbi:hypothetical protein DKX38_028069 [Salix brachista]|uniref:Calponin-homology (CH) domain-containing protein n=1 Tax=Salix brachista TaxID=2182728 RepID=A0A5N5J9U1_9ROSI|nr:hypothetical protein DKX38_028069 [Salix brachista]